jgi:heme-degrading monooxygenase HmoA
VASVSRVPADLQTGQPWIFFPHGKEVVRTRVFTSVIARWWRGWAATAADADAYEELLRSTIFPWVRTFEGQEGTYLFRRELPAGEVEFATLTLWESWDAVRAFAGDDAETAVVPEEARAVLSRWDERSAHYELIEGPAG